MSAVVCKRLLLNHAKPTLRLPSSLAFLVSMFNAPDTAPSGSMPVTAVDAPLINCAEPTCTFAVPCVPYIPAKPFTLNWRASNWKPRKYKPVSVLLSPPNAITEASVLAIASVSVRACLLLSIFSS